jgi:hypothetical protein
MRSNRFALAAAPCPNTGIPKQQPPLKRGRVRAGHWLSGRNCAALGEHRAGESGLQGRASSSHQSAASPVPVKQRGIQPALRTQRGEKGSHCGLRAVSTPQRSLHWPSAGTLHASPGRTSAPSHQTVVQRPPRPHTHTCGRIRRCKCQRRLVAAPQPGADSRHPPSSVIQRYEGESAGRP